MAYCKRIVDKYLLEWKNSEDHKPLLIRGARQVGKSTAVRELGKDFKYFVEINLEKQTSFKDCFTKDINVKQTCAMLSALTSIPIVPNQTLLFIDEIQECQNAIMSLRYFYEDYPELHVVAAGSLLEFALQELPSFGVGRIRSLYMYPFSFDEFLLAQGLDIQCEYKNGIKDTPIPLPIHNALVQQLRSYYYVGGMPAVVNEWVKTQDYLSCARIQTEILDTYQDDFSKYKSRISPDLLRQVLRSVSMQSGSKFVFSQVSDGIHSSVIREALNLLSLAGLILPVTHTSANGFPLGAEANNSYVKYLFFDIGLMQHMLSMPVEQTLLSSDIDFVNKGALSEVFVGLEYVKYKDYHQKPELYYWQSTTKSGNAEVDYIIAHNGEVTPVEVKANTKGSMQSLYFFMRKKKLVNSFRVSLENFSHFTYKDPEEDIDRHIFVRPLYAVASII